MTSAEMRDACSNQRCIRGERINYLSPCLSLPSKTPIRESRAHPAFLTGENNLYLVFNPSHLLLLPTLHLARVSPNTTPSWISKLEGNYTVLILQVGNWDSERRDFFSYTGSGRVLPFPSFSAPPLPTTLLTQFWGFYSIGPIHSHLNIRPLVCFPCQMDYHWKENLRTGLYIIKVMNLPDTF